MRVMTNSKVSRLIEQIDAEDDAARQALYGFADGIARYTFISARINRIGEIKEDLSEIVGVDKALQIVCERLNR